MKFANTYLTLFIFVLSISLIGQTNAKFYSKKVYIYSSLGLKHHQPILPKSEYIKMGFIPDLVLEVGVLTFSGTKHGWQISISGSTKNYRVKLKDSIPGLYNRQAEWGLSNWYYQFTLNKTYNFNVSKKVNAVVNAGSIIYFNSSNQLTDSIAQQRYYDIYLYNVRAIGLGLNLGVILNRRISEKKYFSVGLNYQRGFVNFLNLYISNPNFPQNNSVSRFFGSGPSVKLGLLF